MSSFDQLPIVLIDFCSSVIINEFNLRWVSATFSNRRFLRLIRFWNYSRCVAELKISVQSPVNFLTFATLEEVATHRGRVWASQPAVQGLIPLTAGKNERKKKIFR